MDSSVVEPDVDEEEDSDDTHHDVMDARVGRPDPELRDAREGSADRDAAGLGMR